MPRTASVMPDARQVFRLTAGFDDLGRVAPVGTLT
jgi:hypothetical protein